MKRAEYLDQLREGKRRGAAAEAVGVDRETVRLTYNSDPEFATAVEQAEIDACDIVEDALLEAAKSGNVVACQVWLYNRAPNRWKDQRNVRAEIGGFDPNRPVQIDVTHRLAALAVELGLPLGEATAIAQQVVRVVSTG